MEITPIRTPHKGTLLLGVHDFQPFCNLMDTDKELADRLIGYMIIKASFVPPSVAFHKHGGVVDVIPLQELKNEPRREW